MTAGALWRAAWVVPVSGEPIRDGAVAFADGAITAVGPFAVVAAGHAGPVRDLGDAVVAPGFVDAHCHLEWSLMDGLVPDGPFAAWLSAFIPLRMRMAQADHRAAAGFAAVTALAAGTTTLADSGPTGAGVAAASGAGLRAVVHLEAFGREEGAAARDAAAATAERVAELDDTAGPLVHVGVSPHAPYSVGPALWAALAARADLAVRPWATHIAESPDEVRLVTAGDGPLGDLFTRNGWSPARWDGAGGVVARLHRGGALRAGTVAAHCVHVDPADARTLAAAGVAVAHCPESNRRLRCGRAPLEELLRAGVRVGIGTDSPASAGRYDMRAEARRAASEAVAAGAPVPAPDLLVRLMTLGGAEALGMEAVTGSLEPGKRADLVAVAPAGGAAGEPCAALLDPAARVVEVTVDGRDAVRGGTVVSTDAERAGALWHEARTRVGKVPG